jgi:hypothetical protein
MNVDEKDESEPNDGDVQQKTKCIEKTELWFNNIVTTSTPTLATESSAVTPVPFESQWSENKMRPQFSKTTSIIAPTDVTLPNFVSEGVSFFKPTVNLIDTDEDTINNDVFSSTIESITETQDKYEISISSSASPSISSSKKSVIRLPIIILMILLQYCLYYNELRVLLIELSDLRCHRRTFFIYNLLYYRIKS